MKRMHPRSWKVTARETCLTCHKDKKDHQTPEFCVDCHPFRSTGKARGKKGS